MRFKGIYSERSAWAQLLVLLLLVLTGAFLASFIGLGLFFLIYGFNADMYQHIDMLRFIQFISATGTFILPALGIAWLCSEKPKQYLYFNKPPQLLPLLLAFACLLLLMPTINLVELLNRQMILPDFLAPVETWMKDKEESATRLTELFLSENDLLSLLANLLVIAATAAIGEELFFRGMLQRIIGKWSRNPHLVIWAVAIIFSAFHLQFYGFLPRMLLGAFFGYLIYWSKNIWLPIFAHFMNNALAVITLSNADLKENHYMTGELSQQEIIPYTIIALIFLGFFVLMAKKLRQKLDQAATNTKNLSFEE